MQIQFIGVVEASDVSERTDTERASLLSRLGFDGIQISDHSGCRWSIDVATRLASDPNLPAITFAHRPGIISPVEAASRLADLDRANDGRLSILISSTPLPSESAGFVHETDQARTDEYLVLLKRLWLNQKPFDHEGAFFSVHGGLIASRPLNGGTIPLVLAGRSATAIRIAARHADCYKLGGLDKTSAMHAIARMEAMAVPFGRAGKIRFNVDIEPSFGPPQQPSSREIAEFDLAMKIAGTAEQIALALLKYIDLGISQFTIHGLADAAHMSAFAEDVMPLVRRGVQHRVAQEPGRADLEVATTANDRRDVGRQSIVRARLHS